MFSDIKKEIKQLREICKEKGVIDIVLLGYNKKEKASKINLTIVFKDKKAGNNLSLKVKEIFNKKQMKADIMLLLVDDLFKDILYLRLIQNGFSINQNKFIGNSLNTETLILVTYDLKTLNHSKKTLFGYALKGRKDQKGFLDSLNGNAVGRNNVLIPINELKELKEFLKTWNIKYYTQKFVRINEG
jgi:hypothetical protein